MIRKIGFDIDDTLGIFCSDFLDFYNGINKTNFKIEDINRDVHEALGITPEVERAWFDAYDESDRLIAMKPVAGTIEVVNRLYQQRDILTAITSRPDYTKEKTKIWLEKIYKNSISELYFKPKGIRKAQICLERNIQIMVEDNLKEALACAEAGILTYLLDHPWNQNTKPKDNLVRVYSWEDLGRIL